MEGDARRAEGVFKTKQNTLMKQQIVIIHWGVAKENYSDYLDYVRTIEYDPYAEKLQRWKQTLPIELWENFEYFYPVMPNKHYADYDAWKEMFEKVIAKKKITINLEIFCKNFI